MKKGSKIPPDRLLACEMESSSDENRRWLGVYRLDPGNQKTRDVLKRYEIADPIGDDPVFRIRIFEVSKAKNGEDEWLSESDLSGQSNYFAFGESALCERLESFGIDPTNLKPQGETEYPI